MTIRAFKLKPSFQTRCAPQIISSCATIGATTTTLVGDAPRRNPCKQAHHNSGRSDSNRRRPAWEERNAFLRKALKALSSSSLATSVVFANRRILTRFDAFCGSTTTFSHRPRVRAASAQLQRRIMASLSHSAPIPSGENSRTKVQNVVVDSTASRARLQGPSTRHRPPPAARGRRACGRRASGYGHPTTRGLIRSPP